MIRQVHGLMAYDTDSTIQRVQLTDNEKTVGIFHTGQKTVYLTSDDCRFLARQLVEAAKRLDERTKT